MNADNWDFELKAFPAEGSSILNCLAVNMKSLNLSLKQQMN